ncbi:helix-turn-helix domain-containing protein [Streptomyces sp. NPDC005012]|uniref:PucR family transcriptional regulator n=1 Tax=Streptomyces sp. NPDC005012 TaxID=3154558 RepID=UPI0033AD96F5
MTNDAPGPLTLRRLLDYDEDGILRLVLAPHGFDVAVSGVVIGDEGPDAVHHGRVLLATGLDPDAAEAPETVREAARRGAAALVLRAPGEQPPQAVVDAARAGGIALFARADWADWNDTVELLRAAAAFAEAGTADPLAQHAAAGGLHRLVTVAAGYCGGSITVEDNQFRVIAHSATSPDADGLRQSTILGGRVPEWRVAEMRRSGLLRALWTSRDVIHRPARGEEPERLIVAVRRGGELLGSLWAAADGGQLSEDAPEVLRRAAEIAVPYLVRHRLSADTGRRRENHALRGLLRQEGDARTHLWTLGLEPDTPCAVVVAAHDAPPGPVPDRTLMALALQAVAHRASARTVRERHHLTVLLPVPDGDPQEALTLARELAALAAAMPDAPAVWAGAGDVVDSPLDAARSQDEALLVVRVLRQREGRDAQPGGPARHQAPTPFPSPTPAADGRPPYPSPIPPPAADGRPPVRHAGLATTAQAVTALRFLDAARPVWRDHGGAVRDLLRADLAAGGDLLRSLAAFLDASGDIPRAAARLTLHPNTLRYRLRRARERFGLDLDDPDTRLLLTLAVRLETTGGDSSYDPQV